MDLTVRGEESEVAARQARRRFTPEFKAEAIKLVNESGRPIVEVARDIGVNEGTLGNWVNLWRGEHPDAEPELGISERAELAELRRENQRLRMEREFLKKGSPDASVGHVRPGRVGRWPPRLSMARAMRASGERKPNAIRVMRRILVLTDSMRPFDRPCSTAARIEARCLTIRHCSSTKAGI